LRYVSAGRETFMVRDSKVRALIIDVGGTIASVYTEKGLTPA